MAFRPATKKAAKGRIAFTGPAGSGKTWTGLMLATQLSEQEERISGRKGIAAIDTEQRSMEKYADAFHFDVDCPSSFTASYFVNALTEAESGNYAVFFVDSLSHFWIGKDGALEFVDKSQKGQRDGMSGWKDWRPHEREMVDRMLASPCHVIATMRTKNEYVEGTDDRGKKVRRKIGLAPVQRDGLEYEFDFVGAFDEDNGVKVDKTRCSAYMAPEMRYQIRPDAKYFAPFLAWLSAGETTAEPHGGPRAAEGVPPQVALLWERGGRKRESIAQVIGECMTQLKWLLGPQEAADVLSRVVAEHGDPFSSVKAFQAVSFELWKTERAEAQKRAAANPEITDDDLPPELRGEEAVNA